MLVMVNGCLHSNIYGLGVLHVYRVIANYNNNNAVAIT